MMSMYVKSIVLNICKSSFINVCKYVKHYPIVSILSFLLFLLYLFIPSVFVFFIYISPLFAIAATLFYRSRSKAQDAKRNGIKQEKKIEKKLSTLGKSKSVANDRPTVTKPTRSMSQRRNKEKFFVEADPIIAHDVKASISDFLREVRNKRDEKEQETTKAEYEEGGGLCFLNEIRDSNPKLEIDPPLAGDQRGGGGGEESGSSEDDKAAAEWNEDDQKNLMDLGISEMERNKRLESLIARRRSRKFYKMNSEKGMIVDIDVIGPCSSPSVAASEIVSPVLISTSRIHDHLLLHGSLGDDQFPGSAPSILLPGKNPFDLPYDPHEEKPDLMTDSFQQEFSIPPHKEMFMCRHESFSLGHTTRAKIHSGAIDEQKPPRHFDPIARTVSVTDLVVTDLLEPRQPDDSPTSEIVQLTSDDSIRREEKNVPKDSNDQGSEISPNPRPPSLPRPMPKAASASDLSNDASLSIIHNTRVDEHYQNNRGTWHTPTNSVASDLQVEVSDVGSPPSTVDGTDSDDDNHDGGSLTYDGDTEKEVNSGSEELWGLSPHAPRIGKHELALRFLNEASEEGMREARFAENVQGFEKEEEVVVEELMTRDNKDHHIIADLQESKEILDPLQLDVEVEIKKNNEMDRNAGKIDNTEELKSIERQTIYEITDDLSKPAEEIVTEPSSHIERELVQGPEKLADVIVKSSEQIDSASSSTSDLVGGVEPMHHNDDLGIRDDSVVVPTPANEASRFIEDVEASGGSNIRDENVQRILTPSETQSTNSVVDVDQDLTYLSSIPSPVSVLVDVNQQEAEMSSSPISQQVHDMEESAYHVDQTPTSHNEPHRSSESSNGEIDSRESLVRVNDQDHDEMEFPPRQWNDEDHNVQSKGKDLSEILQNGDPAVTDETHVKEGVPKSFEDITYNPNSYGHDEVATSNASKNEDSQYRLNLEEKVEEDRRLAEEATGESSNNGNVIDEGNEGKSLSITQKAIAEPKILSNMLAPSDDLEIESLSAVKQEPVAEIPKPAHLVPSNDLQGDVVEAIRQDGVAEIVKPRDIISQQTLEGESLSSVRREAMAESAKEVDMISTKSLLEGDESMSSIKEAITSMEQSRPVVDSVPLMAVEVDSLASVQLEASKESLKTDDLMPSNESLSSIKQVAPVEAYGQADSMPSNEAVEAVPIQTEVVHIETSKPIVEAETPSLSKNISPEKVELADMDIEHNVDESVHSLVQIAEDKIDIDHNHLQNPNPLVGVDQMDNHQNSKTIDVDVDGEEEDEGASSTASRQDGHLITNSDQPTDEFIKQVDEQESKRVVENKDNNTMIVPPQAGGEGSDDHHDFDVTEDRE